jgi:hypothetical protein
MHTDDMPRGVNGFRVWFNPEKPITGLLNAHKDGLVCFTMPTAITSRASALHGTKSPAEYRATRRKRHGSLSGRLKDGDFKRLSKNRENARAGRLISNRCPYPERKLCGSAAVRLTSRLL